MDCNNCFQKEIQSLKIFLWTNYQERDRKNKIWKAQFPLNWKEKKDRAVSKNEYLYAIIYNYIIIKI